MGGRWLRSAVRAHREGAIDYKSALEERTEEQILSKELLLSKTYTREDIIQLLQSQLLIGMASSTQTSKKAKDATIQVSEGLLSVLLNTRIEAQRVVTEEDMLDDPEKAAEYYKMMTGRTIVEEKDGSEKDE